MNMPPFSIPILHSHSNLEPDPEINFDLDVDLLSNFHLSSDFDVRSDPNPYHLLGKALTLS